MMVVASETRCHNTTYVCAGVSKVVQLAMVVGGEPEMQQCRSVEVQNKLCLHVLLCDFAFLVYLESCKVLTTCSEICIVLRDGGNR